MQNVAKNWEVACKILQKTVAQVEIFLVLIIGDCVPKARHPLALGMILCSIYKYLLVNFKYHCVFKRVSSQIELSSDELFIEFFKFVLII